MSILSSTNPIKKIKSIDEIKSCKVNVVFEPAWNKDMMSDEAKLELGML